MTVPWPNWCTNDMVTTGPTSVISRPPSVDSSRTAVCPDRPGLTSTQKPSSHKDMGPAAHEIQVLSGGGHGWHHRRIGTESRMSVTDNPSQAAAQQGASFG